uniref:hypothetical protein n=1 Tax=Flavobacterium sp. TaxID=239 RepID=UPI00404A0148
MKTSKPQSPLLQKAFEIVQLTIGLEKIIPEDNEFLQASKGFMLENAYMLPTKIAGAEAVDFYDLRMEYATIIRKAARELFVQAGSLRFEKDINANDYILLLRNTIDDFRILFIGWVQTFNQNEYIPDAWGLFNPPGVSPEDYFKDDLGNQRDSKEKLEDYDNDFNRFLDIDDDLE